MRARSLLCLLLAAVVLAPILGFTAQVASAREGKTRDLRQEPRIELVLDSSGSMAQEDAGGETRIAAAKQAAYDLIDGLPDQADVGLRVYGATYGGDNEKKGCRDTQLLVPIGELADEQAAREKIGKLEPTGFTPIGRSLRKAAEDVGSSGPRRIILVSDGKDTCAPPAPCKVAEDLERQGIELVIDTVGFKVGTRARDQLQCVAEATGGRYSDASRADELTQRVQELLKRAVREYRAVGTPVEGVRQGCTAAPSLRKDAQYLDHLREDDELWYRIPVERGQRLRVTVATILVSGFGRGSDVESMLAWPNGEEIASDYTHTVGWTNFIGNGMQTETFGSSTLRIPENAHAVCLQISNGIYSSDGTRFPTEIRVNHFDGEPVAGKKPTRERAPATGEDPPGSPTRATGDSADSAWPLAAGLGMGGLLVGGVAGAAYGRRRH